MLSFKKLACLGFAIFLISGCTNNEQDKTPAANTTTVAKNDAIIEAIETKWNSSTKQVEVTKTEDMWSSDIEPLHTEYSIKIIDKAYLDLVAPAHDRIYSNSANKEDIKLINDIRTAVKEIAQKLNNDVDAVQFVYTDEAGNVIVVAYSQKNRDIIPLEKEVAQSSGFITEPANSNMSTSNNSMPSNKVNRSIIKPTTNSVPSSTEVGFQPYNGFGDYNEYLKYKNDTGYGNGTYDPSHPYPNEEVTTIDPSLIQYSEDENGNLIMNPVYDYNNQE